MGQAWTIAKRRALPTSGCWRKEALATSVEQEDSAQCCGTAEEEVGTALLGMNTRNSPRMPKAITTPAPSSRTCTGTAGEQLSGKQYTHMHGLKATQTAGYTNCRVHSMGTQTGYTTS